MTSSSGKCKKHKFFPFLTRDSQEQQVDGSGVQTAHSLLNAGSFVFPRQDEGGQNSHQGLDGHPVLPQRRPHVLQFNMRVVFSAGVSSYIALEC